MPLGCLIVSAVLWMPFRSGIDSTSMAKGSESRRKPPCADLEMASAMISILGALDITHTHARDVRSCGRAAPDQWAGGTRNWTRMGMRKRQILKGRTERSHRIIGH